MLLSDALQEMEQRDSSGEKKPFSVSYVKFDKARRTGGQLATLSNVRTIGSASDQKKNQTITVRAAGNTRHPYVIHIRLILEFNGKPIVW